MTDWRAWHSHYDDADSSLAHRLRIVRQRICESLNQLNGQVPIRILSLCAGAGRDLLPELLASAGTTYRALLVEKEPSLAQEALATVRDLNLSEVGVLVGDAGLLSNFVDFLPVDLLLLCGIFGHICEDDIRATVAVVPAMLRPGGVVIWTRGSSDPDPRPIIRSWFRESGLEETSWDSEPEGYGVGVARRRPSGTSSQVLPARLFTFVG